MSTEYTWLMRPCLEGMCDYGELKDGSLDLVDIRRMNNELDARNENERRIYKAMQKK